MFVLDLFLGIETNEQLVWSYKGNFNVHILFQCIYTLG